MVSLSSLLNPSTNEKARSEDQPQKIHNNRPTSVSELLIGQSDNVTNENNSSKNTIDQSPSNRETSNSQNVSSDSSNVITSKPSSETASNYAEAKGYQTLLINSRSRHLKKNDGEPYWRNEIQFEFLMRLFFNHYRVFKNPYFNTIHGFDWPDHFRYYRDEKGNLQSSRGEFLTFFELYLITLLKSSKISKILKARLMLDLNYALNFSVICLLVNIGRLNTTVNFDFEMKSQFRTYHSIPSLQVSNHSIILEKFYQIPESEDKIGETKENELNSEKETLKDTNGYVMSAVKQLQDTPRIKSILKSVNDLSGKSSKTFKDFIDDVSKEDNQINVVSMVFSICAHEYDIGQSFFPFDYDSVLTPNIANTGSLLNDIWLRPKLKSTDKVQRFLWLLYTLLETNLSVPEILENPFNIPNTSISNLKLENRDNLWLELSVIDHKNPRVSPTITAIKGIIPKLNIINSTDIIDPLLHDFDTAQEVEFAAQMKHLRTQFVAAETANSGIVPAEEELGKKETKEEEQHVVQSDLTGRSIQVKTPNSRKRARQESDDFSPHFYNPVKTRNYSRKKIMESATSNYSISSSENEKQKMEDYSFENTNIKDDNNHDYNEYDDDYELNNTQNKIHSINQKAIKNEKSDLVNNKVEIDDSYNTSEELNYNNDETDDEDLSTYETKDSGLISSEYNTGNSDLVVNKGLKRPNDESVELSSMDPMLLSTFEDNYESGGLIGFFNYGYSGYVINEYKKNEDGSILLTSCVKRRKTRRQINIEHPIKTSVSGIEAFLNKDNKSINSHSKKAIMKRERNRILAEFLFELINYKQSQAKELRISEGNWRHFTKRLWDLNMFVEKEQKVSNSNYNDWGEFKVTMLKVMNKVNCSMNARSKIEKTLEEKSTSRKEIKPEPTFIDTLFTDL